MKYKVIFPHSNNVNFLGIDFKNGEGVVDESIAKQIRPIHTIQVVPIEPIEEVEPQDLPVEPNLEEEPVPKPEPKKPSKPKKSSKKN